MTTVYEINANAKRCLAECNKQIAEIDAEMDRLVEKLTAGEVTALFVKIRELTLRERREQAEVMRKAMLGVIKHF